jgi:hypothetical protein
MTMRNPDLFKQLDEEITLFIESMTDRAKADYAMGQMLKTASKIGGQPLQDVEQLVLDYRKLMHRPLDEKNKKILTQDALRIKHEVREL